MTAFIYVSLPFLPAFFSQKYEFRNISANKKFLNWTKAEMWLMTDENILGSGEERQLTNTIERKRDRIC